jgi:hypothetical protein
MSTEFGRSISVIVIKDTGVILQPKNRLVIVASGLIKVVVNVAACLMNAVRLEVAFRRVVNMSKDVLPIGPAVDLQNHRP